MRDSSRMGGQRLETTLRPELTLHLTQEMRLRLEILQANILSLEEMVELELQQNPALELVDAEPSGEEEKNTEEFSIEDYYPSDIALSRRDSKDRPEPSSPCADRSTLEEHMMRAVVREFSTSSEDYRIARLILDSLDVDGFLNQDPEQLVKALGTDAEKVERVRRLIQRIEPVGIASRDVREALIVQLRVLGYDDESPEIRILSEGFDMLLQKRITSLANKLKIPTETAAAAFETISSLDPKPGRNFREIPCRSVQPDMAVKYLNGRLSVTVNESPLPPLRLSARVREILENPGSFSKDEIDFARRKYEGAQQFIKGILQRRDTLNRLAQEILTRNYDYFSGRTKQITPLLMKDIANALELHISTISRAVRDKYIETPVGIFPLRSFFSKGERNPLMVKLNAMIDDEDKQKPLTDATIAERFKRMGIKISRRTVAKYRLMLNIPDCFQRKALGQ